MRSHERATIQAGGDIDLYRSRVLLAAVEIEVELAGGAGDGGVNDDVVGRIQRQGRIQLTGLIDGGRHGDVAGLGTLV